MWERSVTGRLALDAAIVHTDRRPIALPKGVARREQGTRSPGPVRHRQVPRPHLRRDAKFDADAWSFRVLGLVEHDVSLNYTELRALPKFDLTADFHCVTQWSRLDNRWGGVAIQTIAEMAKPLPTATHVMAHCDGGYTTNLPIDVLLDDDVLLAYEHDGENLASEHGMAPAPHRPQALRVEEREMAARARVPGYRPPGVLGNARLSQRRRPLVGRALLLARAARATTRRGPAASRSRQRR